MPSETSATLRRIASSDVRANLADLLRQVGDEGERVLIERRGKTSVALISVDDPMRFQLLEKLARVARRPEPTSRRATAARKATA